ncbi:uncharacterized protein [Diadema antillarum]|uniref:uncharacterized protein n=1 Tax=Diadema antillarum TaxID=105358 RepID=UPI003A883953
MEPVNDTLTDKIARAPPDNPMYAGGIAVLVAFVLFMYWGSLNEKEEKDESAAKPKTKIPNWFQDSPKRHRRKKRKKKKRKGVYSVSDAMKSSLACEAGAEDCEMCRLTKFEVQDERTKSFLQGALSSSRRTQTARSPHGARSVGNVRTADTPRLIGLQRQRSHSSPDITVLTNFPACTCPIQNGSIGVSNPATPTRTAWAKDSSKITPCSKGNCEKGSRCEDFVVYETEVVKGRRPMEDACVHLETNPGVTIAVTIATETVV